jgi:hypothetical protein
VAGVKIAIGKWMTRVNGFLRRMLVDRVIVGQWG